MTRSVSQPGSKTFPGSVIILGEATNAASVSVNTNPTHRKRRYFRAELAVENSANPVWLGITNVAVLPVGSGQYVVSNITGQVFVPKTPESFSYDADGNLTSDGRWNYTWDAENRVVRVMSYGAADRAGWRRVDWAYDALGRRTRQTSYVLSNGVWVVTEDLKFVSDPVWFGRHIAELNATNHAVVRSYVWALDLSETLDGAGGVGGLLWVRLAGGLASETHFVTYDGNGNVWQLVSASTSTETARYEYGPFGEPIRVTGPTATENVFRFSTKRTDDTTELVLYEYRAYSPSPGRWPTGEPIAELGAGSLYGLVYNNPLFYIDRDGLDVAARFPELRPTVPSPDHWEYSLEVASSGHSTGSGIWVLRPFGQEPALAERRWPPHKPTRPPSVCGIQLCTREVNKDGSECRDRCILERANRFSVHGYLVYAYDAHGKRRGIGCNDPYAQAGAKPRPEEDVEKYPLRWCNTCWKGGLELPHGAAKGKNGVDATDNEMWQCLQEAPLEKDYHGYCYNCRHWARSAARRCGLLCTAFG